MGTTANFTYNTKKLSVTKKFCLTLQLLLCCGNSVINMIWKWWFYPETSFTSLFIIQVYYQYYLEMVILKLLWFSVYNLRPTSKAQGDGKMVTSSWDVVNNKLLHIVMDHLDHATSISESPSGFFEMENNTRMF